MRIYNEQVVTGQHVARRISAAIILMVAAAVSARNAAAAAPNVAVWDAKVRLTNTAEVDRAARRIVPTELFSLEREPAKAASDPGYYGREYAFLGDAVVENQRLTAVFLAAEGRVVIYAKEGSSQPVGDASRGAGLGKRIVEILPPRSGATAARIRDIQVLRNAADEVALEVTFAHMATPIAQALFMFDRTEIVEIKPAGAGSQFVVQGSIEQAIVPSFIGDDQIYSAADNWPQTSLYIPSENMLLGLLRGEESEFVMTWLSTGKQQIRLQLGDQPPGQRLIESLEFQHGGQSFYLAPLVAPGIWHKETLGAAFLEKDVVAKWRRPFPAKWKTQLLESNVKTTFALREGKGQVWRGVPGSYSYPVWFDGEEAYFRLSKKVPPKGESLIYFVEGRDTPLSVNTPVDILKATLGRQASDAILDAAGRKLRTHHRRGGEGVHRACTCGCTEAIQAIFEAGQEVSQKEVISAALDDMLYFVRQHVERIEEYRRFAEDMVVHLKALQKSNSPELASYLTTLEEIAARIPEECRVQQENMKSLEHAQELNRLTLALTGRQDAKNLKAYMELFTAWRAMGGAQDYVVAQCHTITRKLYQEAGYRCVGDPRAAVVAQDIRARCRQVLRNADGYEIWADY